MFGSIFGMLFWASTRKSCKNGPAKGLLRSSNQKLTDQLAAAVLKLKRGRSAFCISGGSAKSLSLVAAGLANLTAKREDEPSRTVQILKARCLTGSEEIRRLYLDAQNTLLVIENIELLKSSKTGSLVSALDRFVRFGGSLIVTAADALVTDLPSTWTKIFVPDLSQRKADVLIIWDQLAGAGFAKKILPQVQSMLLAHQWSGGLAELIEAMDSAQILSERSSRAVVHVTHMAKILKDPAAAGENLRLSEFIEASGIYRQATDQGVDRVMRQILAMLVAKALKESFGNKRRAAQLLGMPCSTFSSRVRAVQTELSASEQWV